MFCSLAGPRSKAFTAASAHQMDCRLGMQSGLSVELRSTAGALAALQRAAPLSTKHR